MSECSNVQKRNISCYLWIFSCQILTAHCRWLYLRRISSLVFYPATNREETALSKCLKTARKFIQTSPEPRLHKIYPRKDRNWLQFSFCFEIQFVVIFKLVRLRHVFLGFESNIFASLTDSYHRFPSSFLSCHGDQWVQRRHVVDGRILDGHCKSSDTINERSWRQNGF